MTALETLWLWDTQVADAGLVHLAGLRALKELHLDRTQITDAGLPHLTGLMALESLYLRGTQITDVGDIVKCCGSASGVIKRLPPDPPRYVVPVVLHR